MTSTSGRGSVIELDKFFEQHVEFGKYQIFLLLLLFVPACFMDSYMSVAIIFMAYKPKHRCRLFANETDGNFTTDPAFALHKLELNTTHYKTIRADECSLRFSTYSRLNDSFEIEATTSDCEHGWLFDMEYFDSTLASQFDLVCNKEIHSTIMLMILGLAGIIGAYPLSWIQDRFGRKAGFLVCTSIYFVFGLLSLFAPDIWSFTALRFLCSLPSLACFNVCYIWGLEFVGPNKRTLASTLLSVGYGMATMFYGLIGYLCKTWVHIGLATTLPFIVTYSYYWLLDESPRWLLTQGRTAEARAVLERISRWEKVPLQEHVFRQLVPTNHTNEPSAEPEESTRGTFMDLFRGRNIRLKTILLTFCMFANSIVYMTIAYNSGNLGGNIFLVFVLQAAAEAPGALVNILLLNRYGRIWPLAGSMILSGIACVLTAPGALWPTWVIVSLATIGKFCIASSYATVYQVTSELYPTVIRAIGTGFSTLIADFSSVVMPYILFSGETYQQLPMIILGVFAILGGFSVLLLPETRGLAMPQTVDESEHIADVGIVAFRANVSRFFVLVGQKKQRCMKQPSISDSTGVRTENHVI